MTKTNGSGGNVWLVMMIASANQQLPGQVAF
jgi:hypothetical protein